jgi:hypothetical protein
VAAKESPGRNVFGHVARVVLEGIARTRDSEIDGTVPRLNDVAAKDEATALEALDKRLERTGSGIETQQAFGAVADQNATVGAYLEAERSTPGLRQRFYLTAARIDANDATIL